MPAPDVLQLDAGDLAERKAFLEFGEADAQRLRHLHALLGSAGHAFADSFYAHLLSFAPLRSLIPDEGSLQRLQCAQAEYFNRLTAGVYDENYAAHRVRVGLAHYRIGLEPKWYIGAYRSYLSGLMPVLWKKLGDCPEDFLATYDALLKVVLFDMGLALDSYYQADRQALQEMKNYADRVICTMPSGLMVLDERLCLRTINLAARDMLGLDETEALAGRMLESLLPSPTLLALAREVLDKRQSSRALPIGPLPGQEGRILALVLSSTLIDEAPALIVQMEDQTESILAEESLARFRTALDASEDAFFLIDRVTMRFVDVNESACSQLGYSRRKLLTLGPADIKPLLSEAELAARFDEILASPARSGRIETLHRRKNGGTFPVEVALRGFRSEGRQMLVAVARDITARRRAEEELLHVATHDALTALPNRTLLQDRVRQAIHHAARMEREAAVLFIDIDRFKNINDSLGHEAGDILISALAQRLRGAVRMVDTVARVGGDEFVVVLTDVMRESDITQVLASLLAAIAQPVPVESHELSVTASIGIGIYPRDGRDAAELLKNADTAMYRAKDAGRNAFRFYTQEMNAGAVGRLRLENDLRNAIKGAELTVYYQPQVDSETGCIVAAEALIRWRHPERGMVSPVEFIPLAEETGLIVPIGEWVLRQVCAQIGAWREAGVSPLKVAVNLSPRQFRQPNLVGMVCNALSEHGLPSAWLELEITESSLMHNPEEAAAQLRELSEQGLHLAVDDFGTGYSSLAYLKRFPLHALKIDRSFVTDIEHNRDSAAIAAAVIALAHSLGLKVVAEGVERAEQMAYLRGLGCDYAQGYLYGRPMPAEAFMASLSSQPCLADAGKNT